jgi:hypothetical protein
MHQTFLYSAVNLVDPPVWMTNIDVTPWLNLPEDQLRSQALSEDFSVPPAVDPNSTSEAYSERVLQDHQYRAKSGYFFSRFLPSNATAWAKENISSTVQDIRFTFTTPGRDRIGPHIDRTRDYTLIYLLADGGRDHETVFYKKLNDTEIIRPRFDYENDYQQLTKIGSIKIPLHTWYLLNARVLHSVENIPNSRIAIQVSFSEYPSELDLMHSAYHMHD